MSAITAVVSAFAVAASSVVHAQTPTPTATPVCGDGVVLFPETCDPPGSPTLPNGTLCRATCTSCGDGVLQPGEGESCDDGNAVSGCRVDQPQKPLDGCLNSCSLPICDDPARIQRFDEPSTGKKDVVQFHARLITPHTVAIEGEPFELEIWRRVCTHDVTRACSDDAECATFQAGSTCTNRTCSHDPSAGCSIDAQCEALAPGSTCSDVAAESVVFRASLAGGVPVSAPHRWSFRDPVAKTAGGFFHVKIQRKLAVQRCAGGSNDGQKCLTDQDCPGDGRCVGYYLVKLRAYGDAERAVPDMQLRVTVGDQHWAVRGLWSEYASAWKLRKKSPFLEAYP